MAGQTINDRLLAARHSIAGQGLAKAVCKATTEEMIGPKKKHLDYLIHCTNEPNVSIPQLANLLVERSQNTNWTVVFKALITVHHMLCYGNERFTQYLASSNSTFQLNNFLDKSGVPAGARVGYDMSPFIRRYAKYLNEKAMSYRSVAFDFCKVKRGKEDGTLRTMNAEKLLKTLPVLQAQLDLLLEFDCTANDLTNGVISMAFMLLFRDLIRLFACYNDGIINLLEKYFDMNKKQCRDALDLYKKFLIRMDRVGEFLKVAENVGIDKGDIPDLTKAPSSLLDALEQHLASLEGKKGSAANTPTQSASNRTNVKSGVSALSSTSTAFGTAASNARLDQTGNGHIDEALRQQALAEEEAAMNQYKAKVQSPTGLSTNPFLSSPTGSGNQTIVDLFNSASASDSQPQKASDDLLALEGNPFADIFGTPQVASVQNVSAPRNMWMTNGNGFVVSTPPSNNNFVTDNNFSSVFGDQEQQSSATQGSIGSVPNPFMADFSAPQSQGGNASSMGLFDQGDGNTAIIGNEAQPQGGDLFSASGQADFFGGDSALIRATDGSDVDFAPGAALGVAPGAGPVTAIATGKSTATPPPRPPPPATGTNSTPRAMSPAIGGASPGRLASNTGTIAGAGKSAFDDLNDSIRMALGGSPSRPAPAVQQLSHVQQISQPQHAQMQQSFGGVFDVSAPMPAGVGQQLGGAGQNVSSYTIPSHTQVSVGHDSPIKQPIAAMGQSANPTSSSKVLTGDLDSSLASLAQNLSINKSGQQQVKGMQWNSPKNTAKTGGPAGWTPQPMAATTGAGYRPMGQGMTQLPPVNFGFPPQSTPLGMQNMPMGMQGMRPMMGAIPGAPVAPGGAPMMVGGANPMMGAPMQQQNQTTALPQGCRCNMIGSISSACDIVSGQCRCKPNITGRQCHQCEIGHWGLATGTGCAPCNCDQLGSYNTSCNYETGQCYCRPGVGGTHCDSCLPQHYGFSDNGCQVCDPCEKAGHICDPDTGRCVCPRLTLGEHCDRCRPGSYDLIPGIGCKPCACTPGSMKSQCDTSGQCLCRVGFNGLRCDRCAPGYYGYPRCRPCNCNTDGTLQCPEGLCHCNPNGQCPCKENAIGRQCNECKAGTFGIAENNPKGCTECFCFGRSNVCHQASFSWGQRHLTRPRLLRIDESVNDVIIGNFGFSVVLPALNGGLNVTNGLSIIPGTQGDVTLPANLYCNYPLYWQLPESFLNDKVISYGGFLKFKTLSKGGVQLRSSLRYPLIQIQGNNKIILEYYQHQPSAVSEFKVKLHESLWQIQSRPDYKVSREVLMVALQNVQHILLKASDYSEFKEATLLEASLDAAVLTPTHSPPLATGVEICECPSEYNNTSCQDPSIGYYRWYNNQTTTITTTSTIVIDLVGQARRCQCNGRSEVCERETGYCLSCSENTAGANCEICAESYHGHPDYGGCKPCPCPFTDKKFSNSCDVRENEEPVCHCKPGYDGARCQRCSYGYYGYPGIPGGVCSPCNCNLAGSASDECDEETGQCNCRPGSTGRDCSECTASRHVFIENVCTSCNDNCTGILLDDFAIMSARLTEETSHIANGSIPPPWIELAYIDSNSTALFNEIERISSLKQRMKSVPWLEYERMMNEVEKLTKNAAELSSKGWNMKPKSEDFKNNIFSSQVEVRNLRDLIEATTSQLIQYGDDIKKVGIKKSLKEARKILNYLKSVNLADKTLKYQNFVDEAMDYVALLNTQFDAAKPIEDVKKNSTIYTNKINDMETLLKVIMENLFNYDTIYNDINKTYITAENQMENIKNFNIDTIESINEGMKLNDESSGFIIDSQNNFLDIPELTRKLDHWSEKLDIKEEILYRLNYEYEDKYVVKAVEHAQNLSDYVDRYVALFDRTRNEAANPLKASQAYKIIVDSLATARISAASAKDTAWEAYHKVFPDGLQAKSLLDGAAEISEKSADQLEIAQELKNLLTPAQDKSNDQIQAIVDLKNSLNSTGTKDNQINIKFHELQSDSSKLQERLVEVKSEHKKLMDSIMGSEKLINDYKDGIANDLKPQLQELKREGDSKISLASEKLTEAQSNIKKADAKLISLAHASAKRQIEFDRWNDTLGDKIKKLKDKIAEARNTADGIRISLKSAEGKKCVRSYRPINLQPSTTTTITITIALTHHRKEGALFYLPSGINDDFVAIEMIEGKIRFLWNVGGGTGIITHPEILENGDPQEDNFWYRIEAERVRNVGKLSVRKQSSTSGKYLPIINSTNAEFGRFDVTNNDRVWLGGIPPSQRRPTELLAANGLPGCIHQVILDGKPIGLWNFVTSAPDKACKACVEGVEDARDDIAYSFNGEGYAVRNRVSSGPYNKYTFGVSINFRTFDENALLFLAYNNKNNHHVMIFMREGRVVLQIGYGGNISMEMSSTSRYNNGNWTKVDAFRQYQLRKNIEKCSLSVGGDIDKRIGAPTPQPKKEDIPDLAQAKYYIGGVPPSFNPDKLMLPTDISFLGCMSNINIQEGYDPMAEQYYGVEPTCSNKPMRIVGFYGDGYLEHRSHVLKKISSIISFSFRTMQDNAALLLSTFQGQEDRMNNIQSNNGDGSDNINDNKDIYYSVAIVNGQVQIRLNGGRGEIILQSNNTFNDGKYHTVFISKKRKDIELRINDAYQGAVRLPTGAAIRAPDYGGLFFGGLPALINTTKMIGSVVPLYGAMKDVIFNDDILRFDDAITFDRALIGRAGPTMGKDPPSYTPSASLSRGLSTQPEGCQKVPYYSLEPGALKFGDKSHSHTQLYLNFKKFWEKNYIIEFDFRTYYPNGLLFITPGIKRKQYLMVIVRDGQLVLLMKSKQRKEILFKTPFNDGNWHHVVINHDERKLTLVVDSQTPRTIKIPRKIGLETVMYIGGLPESGTPFPDQVVAKLETLKGCIRGLRVNGNIYDMVGSTSRPFNVGQCFPSVESGAYFQDEAYAVYKKNFELGAVLELQLEFRTSELSGVLLSITAPGGSPSLSLELNNGKVIMSGDLGDKNPLYVEQHFPSPYTICDNRWHSIQAIYNDEELALKVDELDQKYGLPVNVNDHFMASTASSPLYIGGLPASAPKGTLITRDHFNGCIRNVMIGGERRDWTDMAELHNIHLSSCPVQ